MKNRIREHGEEVIIGPQRNKWGVLIIHVKDNWWHFHQENEFEIDG